MRITYETNHKFLKILESMDSKKFNFKFLKERIKSKGGRKDGKIVTPRRGDYYRRIYRNIDFRRVIMPGQKALYLRTIYDPNRTGSIGLICYPIGIVCYILKPMKVNPGAIIHNMLTKKDTDIFYGDSTNLANFTSGILLHNIGGKFIRSAGTSAILVRKDAGQALLKLKSGEIRYFNQDILGTSGTVSNDSHFLTHYKKAGLIRYLGKRPRTRPSAMNPVDHPMGGRTRGGSFPTNPKGILTLNRPTVKKRKSYILYTKRQLKLLKIN